jgi:hypothetical protein
MTEIKDGVYAAVSGTVGRVFHTKNGAAIEVHVQTERMRYPDRYTVWGLGDQVAQGDRVEVRGWLETSVEEYPKRDGSTGHGVKRTVNAPKLAAHVAQDAGGGAPGDVGPWATVTVPETGADSWAPTDPADVPF